MAIAFWLKNPGMLLARFRYLLWERRNPDKPWLTPEAVAYLEGVLNREMSGLEFGSGRSTKWYAGKLGRLVSIEHSASWYEIVKAQLAKAGVKNVDYRLVPLNHPETQGEQPQYTPMPDYVAVVDGFPDSTFDFVVVDGHYRTNCIRASLHKLKPGGLLLIDDVNMWPIRDQFPVPLDWTRPHYSTNGIKWTGIWQKPVTG